MSKAWQTEARVRAERIKANRKAQRDERQKGSSGASAVLMRSSGHNPHRHRQQARA